MRKRNQPYADKLAMLLPQSEKDVSPISKEA